MATEYISRDSALRAVVDAVELYPQEYDAITKEINFIPAADVRPVVRGRWEIADSYAGPGLMNLRCSVCGEFGGTWRENTFPSLLYKFCPNCGADMREVKVDG